MLMQRALQSGVGLVKFQQAGYIEMVCKRELSV